MMSSRNYIASLLLAILCGFQANIYAQNENAGPFLGMWALTLDYEYANAGWLEVRQEEGYLDADLLWRWASVYPVEHTFVAGDRLMLVQGIDVVKTKAGEPDRKLHPVKWYEVTMTGEGMIRGTAYFPNSDGLGVEEVAFTGKRIPPVGKAPDLKRARFGKPLVLFNGKDLEGWEIVEEGAVNGWSVEDGKLVSNSLQKEGEPHINFGNLRTKATFDDFNLKLEFNIPKGNNSGIYLRGNYEIQLIDSYGKDLDSHNTGALYSRITPSEAAEKPAGEWQTIDITLYKRHLTVILNGKTIIDNQAVKGVTGGALSSDDFTAGPIYFQGDHGRMSFRNIVLTPILN